MNMPETENVVDEVVCDDAVDESVDTEEPGSVDDDGDSEDPARGTKQ